MNIPNFDSYYQPPDDDGDEVEVEESDPDDENERRAEMACGIDYGDYE